MYMQKGVPHTAEAIEKIRKAMTSRWESVSPEERSQIMSKRRRQGLR